MSTCDGENSIFNEESDVAKGGFSIECQLHGKIQKLAYVAILPVVLVSVSHSLPHFCHGPSLLQI